MILPVAYLTDGSAVAAAYQQASCVTVVDDRKGAQVLKAVEHATEASQPRPADAMREERRQPEGMNPTPQRFARASARGRGHLSLPRARAGVSHAQAWLPPKGSFSYSIDYSNILNKNHYTSTGEEVDVGHTDLNIMSLSGSYSPTDRIIDQRVAAVCADPGIAARAAAATTRRSTTEPGTARSRTCS